jgi:hypothetical protein
MSRTIVSTLVAALASFMVGFLWYGVFFASAYMALLETRAGEAAAPPAWSFVAEFGRCIVVASVFAYLVANMNVDSLGRALGLALIVWVGFQLSMLFGSVLHENYPLPLFVIHAGDALAKSIVACVVLMLWQKRPKQASRNRA